MNKKCHTCGNILPLEAFHLNRAMADGHSTRCKACKKEYDAAQLDRRLELERQRRKTSEGKEVRRRANWNARQRHPDQVKAHQAVTNAVRDGKLPHISTQECEKCGAEAQEYHHRYYDLDSWLNVVPLCRECHRSIHESAEREASS
jgi:hypothetical protein